MPAECGSTPSNKKHDKVWHKKRVQNLETTKQNKGRFPPAILYIYTALEKKKDTVLY